MLNFTSRQLRCEIEAAGRDAIVRTRGSRSERCSPMRSRCQDDDTAADLESVSAPRRRENNARGGSGAESSRMGML